MSLTERLRAARGEHPGDVVVDTTAPTTAVAPDVAATVPVAASVPTTATMTTTTTPSTGSPLTGDEPAAIR